MSCFGKHCGQYTVPPETTKNHQLITKQLTFDDLTQVRRTVHLGVLRVGVEWVDGNLPRGSSKGLIRQRDFPNQKYECYITEMSAS